MIIKSILDTDLYKFTTSYAYMKLFPQARHGEDVVNKVWDRHLASEFKRKKAPIYISRKLYE